MTEKNCQRASNTRFLEDLFRFFELNNISYCVVGDTSCLPEVIAGDIDIVIDRQSARSINRLMASFARENSYHLVQILQHEHQTYYYAFYMTAENGEVVYINPDICSDYIRNGQLFLRATDLLNGRRKAEPTTTASSMSFMVPSLEMEFIYYIIKKVDKGEVTQKHWSYLREIFIQSVEPCSKLLQTYWSEPQASAMRDQLQSDSFDDFCRNLPSYKLALQPSQSNSIKFTFLEFVRTVRRVFQPTGLMVALLGPDGAGKTAICNSLLTNLAPAFRNHAQYHLRPNYLKRVNSDNLASTVTPHKIAPRGTALSLIKLLYLALDYSLGYLVKIKPQLVRSHLVVFDRYYEDLLIDPKRYRHTGPKWLTRLVGWIIPKPDLYIILDAPENVIQARKQEVSIEETANQRARYLQLAHDLPNTIVIDTNQPLAKSELESTIAVLEYMQSRVSSRINN